MYEHLRGQQAVRLIVTSHYFRLNTVGQHLFQPRVTNEVMHTLDAFVMRIQLRAHLRFRAKSR